MIGRLRTEASRYHPRSSDFTDLCHRLTNSNLMPCFARAAIQMSPLGGLGAAAVKHTTRAHGRARLTFSYHTPGDVMYRGS
jgi:hypothetical protein